MAAQIAVGGLAWATFTAFVAGAAPTTSNTFVPISPCRLIDTRTGEFRVGPHDRFGQDETRTMQAHGTQGKCSIPSDTTGLALNVTAVGASLDTFLTIWADGERPLASSLNPAPRQPPTPNAVTTPLSGSGSFLVYNLQGNVDVIIDVTGYYTASALNGLESRLGTHEVDIAAVEQSQASAATQIAALEQGQSVIQDTGDSNGTANTRSTYALNPRRYVVEARDGGAQMESVPVDMTVLNDLCLDPDGCLVSLYMRSWDANSIGLLAGSGPVRMSLNASSATQTRFRIEDASSAFVQLGTDNNSSVNHVIQAYDCYFTDGEYLNAVGTDTQPGFNVLNWNGSYPASTMVCVLIVED